MKLPLKYNLSLFLCHLRGGGRQRGNIEKIEFLLNSSGISKEKPKKKKKKRGPPFKGLDSKFVYSI